MDLLNTVINSLGDLGSTFLCPPTWQSFKIYGIYYVYICIGSLIIPSTTVKGHTSPKRGPQLQYSINGFRLTCLSIIIMLVCGGVFPELDKLKFFQLSALVDQFWSLWSTVNIFAILVSILLYVKGIIGKSIMGEV